MKKLIPFFFILGFALAACAGVVPPDAAATPTPQSQPGAPVVLPADPQEIVFQASDGRMLSGYFYPAAVSPAPVVVMMHWVGGDKSDWYEIAPWLQNRGLANPFPNPGTEYWWDPSWFPAVPAGVSYGVFIFSFRDCSPYDAGCASWTPEGGYLDAQAAMQKATTLEGVDPTRIVAIGSSVGADGAPDACAWLNEQQPGSCRGALSLSPGNYMNIAYTDVVQTLGSSDPPVAAWCLADENEYAICQAAEGSGNPLFLEYLIPGGSHGNRMLNPDMDPQPMQLILDFLAETVGS
jgi:predicted esterase